MKQRCVYHDGWIDYNDLTTQSTPIAYTSGTIKLTNDGAGAYSSSVYKPSGITRLWNTATNQFDFSGLNIGDEVFLRIDIIVTTTQPNQEIFLYLDFDLTGTPYQLGIIGEQRKNAGTYNFVRNTHFYIGNLGTKNNPAEIKFYSTGDDDATIKVNGFYISVQRRF